MAKGSKSGMKMPKGMPSSKMPASMPMDKKGGK